MSVDSEGCLGTIGIDGKGLGKVVEHFISSYMMVK